MEAIIGFDLERAKNRTQYLTADRDEHTERIQKLLLGYTREGTGTWRSAVETACFQLVSALKSPVM